MSDSRLAEQLRRMSHQVKDMATKDLEKWHEMDFPNLVSANYPNRRLPSTEEMKSALEGDIINSMLYTELRYRVISRNGKLKMTVEERVGAFENYIKLFNFVISLNRTQPQFELPVHWLFDIVDSFVSQFAAFHQIKRSGQLSSEDVDLLKAKKTAWHPQEVFRYLMNVAKIGGQNLAAAVVSDPSKDATPTETKRDSDAPSMHNTFKWLGQMACMGLLRLHCLVGDYVSALLSLNSIDVAQISKGRAGMVSRCRVSFYFHLGFSFFMCQRYVDALKTCVYYLNYRRQRDHSRDRKSPLVELYVDKMFNLLALAHSFAPQSKLDDFTVRELKQRVDNFHGLQNNPTGDVYRAVFLAAAPAFTRASSTVASAKESEQVSESKDVSDNTLDAREESMAQQAVYESVDPKLQQFVADYFVRSLGKRGHEDMLMGYLRMCQSIRLQQLAKFLQCSVDKVRQTLLVLKQRSQQLRWLPQNAPASETNWISLAPVQFVIDGDVVVVQHSKSQNVYGGLFAKQIYYANDIMDDVRRKINVF